MKALLNTILQAESRVLGRFAFTPREWWYAKVLLLLVWVYPMAVIPFKFNTVPLPEGICALLNCETLLQPAVAYVLVGVSMLVGVLYLMEWRMLITLPVMAFLTLLVFSIESSNGLNGRKDQLTVILFLQFFSYLRFKGRATETNNPAHGLSIFLSAQIMAVVFVMAAITKLQQSGWGWVSHSPNIAVSLLRSFEIRRLDFGFDWVLTYGRWMAGMVIGYPGVVRLGFGVVLLIELFAFVAFYSRKCSRVVGWLLFAANMGFLVLLGIIIPTFLMPVIGYMVNRKPQPSTLPPSGTPPASLGVKLAQGGYMAVVPALYMYLCFAIGDVHPFTTVNLFAQMDSKTTYYYLANQNGEPLIGYTKYVLRSGEVKDIVQTEIVNAGYSLDDMAANKLVAPKVLTHVAKANAGNPEYAKLEEVQLYRHDIELVDGEMKEKDTLLGSLKVSK